MHGLQRKAVLGAVAAVLGFALGPVVSAAEAENTIKYRQSVMKGVGGHFGAIGAIAKKEVDQRGHLVAHANALADLTGMVNAAFKDKTEGGKTRAKAEIWMDMGKFEQIANDTEAAAQALAKALAADPGTDIGPLVGKIADGCKACHKDFREKDK